jgi:predicted PurR-regulated permease PerM
MPPACDKPANVTETAMPPLAPALETPPALSRGQRRAMLIAVVLLAIAGLWTLQLFLPALAWGVVFAVSLWPWYSRLAARYPARAGMALPGGVTFLILLVFVLPLVMAGAALAHDAVALVEWLQQSAPQGIAPPDFLKSLPYGDHLIAWWSTELGQPGALNPEALARMAASWLPGDAGGRVIGGLLHRLLLVVFMLLILFFLLRDGDRIAQGARVGATRAFGPSGERVGEQIVQAIRGTVNGLVVVGLGEGLLLGIAYYVAGVPHPAILGLLTGLLSAIPLGAVIAYVAAAALLAASGHIPEAIAIAVLGSVVVFIADHFIRPVLIGGATRLPFLWVLLGILGGIEAWGLIGLVLGPALMAALLLLWREWIGQQPGPLNPA